jgi:tRNA A37 threonylcarbamoyladenosine synthetase subunit TsaC/SUA5/YrdC
MPNQSETLGVINATGPLAIASATLSGGSPVLVIENQYQLEVLDIGELEVGPLSTIVEQVGEKLEILRVGSLTLEDLRKVASAIELAKQ